jgi:4-hydroxythreonine-4-phosphate dehydrogenase
MTKIAVSSGDPAGIGPDICIKAFGQKKPLDYAPVVFCDADLVKERCDLLNINSDIQTYSGENIEELSSKCLWVNHYPLYEKVIPGSPSTKNARFTIDIFESSVNKTIQKEFDAVVTCPINKEVINRAGIPFTGHTEELARLSNTKKVVMMLTSENLRVALLTTHIALKDVPSKIKKTNLEDTISIILESLEKDFGISNPIIKVLGLNPHSGDGGYIGTEEKEIISPAIESLKKREKKIIGPLSADTAFIEKGSDIKADAFLAMFHDQGLPVIKTSNFGEIVNVTLGLPFVRTSVDHGTAYDKSATTNADESSLIAAAEMAALMTNK